MIHKMREGKDDINVKENRRTNYGDVKKSE